MNGAVTALGPDGQATLSDGDRLVMGDYEIAVRLRGDEGGRTAAVSSGAVPGLADGREVAPEDLHIADTAGSASPRGRTAASAGATDPLFSPARSSASARPSVAKATTLIPDDADLLADLPAVPSVRDPSIPSELPADPDGHVLHAPAAPVAGARVSAPVPPGIAGPSSARSGNADPPSGPGVAGGETRPLLPDDELPVAGAGDRAGRAAGRTRYCPPACPCWSPSPAPGTGRCRWPHRRSASPDPTP